MGVVAIVVILELLALYVVYRDVARFLNNDRRRELQKLFAPMVVFLPIALAVPDCWALIVVAIGGAVVWYARKLSFWLLVEEAEEVREVWTASKGAEKQT